MGFVADLPPYAILDEVQRVPELFLAIKLYVDRDRRPGRLLLTGSSNVLLLPQLADSLAGRMQTLRLHPFSQSELNRESSSFLSTLFSAGFKRKQVDRMGVDLAERVASGGYPEALSRSSSSRRQKWHQEYVEALVQRDVSDFSKIRSLDVLPQLLCVAAAQTAQLFHVEKLAAPFELTRPTIRDYSILLERVFLIERLRPWFSNRINRLVKRPKLHFGDTGLACSLLGLDGAALYSDKPFFGQMLETFVYQELRRQASWQPQRYSFFYFRTAKGEEVDIVIEASAQALVGVEIKSVASVSKVDFKGLRKLRDAAGKRFQAGVVLYDGETCMRMDDNLFAVPLRMLFS